MADSNKPLVLVLGATGFTGQSITEGLLKSGGFRIAALVRPTSVSKPQTETLRTSGVEIRLGDIKDTPEKLRETLAGVDILISAASAYIQEDIFRAAKEVGVQRVVPCDWATPGAKGIRTLHDKKLAVREFVQELGLPYTFIDVGWWMQISLPLPARSTTYMKAKTYEVFGDGSDRFLVTDLRHIGAYVARIIADPRTLNHAVIIWEDEPTQLEAHEIGQRLSGEGESLKAQRKFVTTDEALQWTTEGKAKLARGEGTPEVALQVSWNLYKYSIHILGENTLENAKRLGYLDVRELYPDLPRYTLEDFAKEFYSWEHPGAAFDRFG
ncbi:hypothetical protein VTO73DRAFT_3856 [Trametes versicolor]